MQVLLQLCKKVEKKLTPRTLPSRKIGICQNCKLLNRESHSIIKKLNNPMSVHSYSSLNEYENAKKEKLQAKNLKQQENLDRKSARMKTSNPMFSAETRAKVSATRKERRETGVLIYKSGPEHHLYKGMRSINKTIRISLRKWFLETKNAHPFCSICHSTTLLHTHHLIPLSKIIKDLNYDNLSGKIKDLDQTQLQNLVDRVLQYHNDNPDIAQILCPSCHAKVDPQYRKKQTH